MDKKSWFARLETWLFGDGRLSPPSTAELLKRHPMTKLIVPTPNDPVLVEREQREERMMKEIEANLRKAHDHLVVPKPRQS